MKIKSIAVSSLFTLCLLTACDKTPETAVSTTAAPVNEVPAVNVAPESTVPATEAVPAPASEPVVAPATAN